MNVKTELRKPTDKPAKRNLQSAGQKGPGVRKLAMAGGPGGMSKGKC